MDDQQILDVTKNVKWIGVLDYGRAFAMKMMQTKVPDENEERISKLIYSYPYKCLS